MILNLDTLARYAHGFVQWKNEEGWTHFYRFFDHQLEHFSYEPVYLERCRSTSGISLEFDTNTTHFSFEWKLQDVCGFDSFDLWMNGALVKSHRYGEKETEGSFSVNLPRGGKHLKLVLPLYSAALIRNLTVDDCCNLVSVKKKEKKVLVLGDSISQGNGAGISSCSYVWTLANHLGWNILNQGIGGYLHEEEGLLPMDYNPDQILVAYGANDFTRNRLVEKVEGFYKKLSQLYPGVPVITVTPIWMDREDNAKLWDARDTIKRLTASYPHIRIIDGLGLVAHLPDYFMDGCHPNQQGHLMYGGYLSAAILKESR